MKAKKRIAFILVFAVVLAVLYGLVYGIVRYCKDISETGINDTLPYGFGEEVTVILLAGQSNAAGCSSDAYLKQNVSEEQYQKYENGFDNVYINYYVSGNNDSSAFVKCKTRQGEGVEPGYFGPELGLAERLNELYPERKFFIIKYAWGGTNLFEEWLSPSAGDAGHLYNSFVAFVRASVKYLTAKNYKVNIESMCWMQGESDSMLEEPALNYAHNIECFIRDIRSEFADYASEDGIAFIDAYIAEVIFWTYYKEVNAGKQAVADSDPNNRVIDTIAAGLTVTEEPHGEPDIAHFDSLSEIRLGQLFAEEIIDFLD